jgi:hypothetical protein
VQIEYKVVIIMHIAEPWINRNESAIATYAYFDSIKCKLPKIMNETPSKKVPKIIGCLRPRTG